MENHNGHQFVPKGEIRFTCHRWIGERLACASIMVSEECFIRNDKQLTALAVQDLLKAIDHLSKRS